MSLLKTPLAVNRVLFSNRLVMPPMATEKSSDGAVTDALCAYYDEKSSGGCIGLIITEHSYVSLEGKAGRGQLSVSETADLAGLARIPAVIHKNGSRVIAQISHTGGAADTAITGLPAIAPSAVAVRNRKTVPREMTAEDVLRVENAFIAAAARVKQAGFDGVELHSAHGYLLNQFYSPLSNRRTDSYGGVLGNRIRIHLDIIRGIRETLGRDFLLAVRLGALDYTDGGSTLEDAVAASAAFAAAGADIIDVSGGFNGYTRPGVSEPGYFRDASTAIRAAVKIPVILTGGVTAPEEAEALLNDGAADMIGVGRAILRDSSWASRAISAL